MASPICGCGRTSSAVAGRGIPPARNDRRTRTARPCALRRRQRAAHLEVAEIGGARHDHALQRVAGLAVAGGRVLAWKEAHAQSVPRFMPNRRWAVSQFTPNHDCNAMTDPREELKRRVTAHMVRPSLRPDEPNSQREVPRMSLPAPVLDPPFNITRVSHVILTSRDLDASRRFYSDVLGLVVSDSDKDALYLRGLEEASHHSLVIRRSDDAPVCQAIGFRVLTEADLDKAKDWLDRRGVASNWIEVPHQGRTLRFADGSGAPIELCAKMDIVPRLMQSFDKFHGGSSAASRSCAGRGLRHPARVRFLCRARIPVDGIHRARRHRRIVGHLAGAQGQSARHRIQQRTRAAASSFRLHRSRKCAT